LFITSWLQRGVEIGKLGDGENVVESVGRNAKASQCASLHEIRDDSDGSLFDLM